MNAPYSAPVQFPRQDAMASLLLTNALFDEGQSNGTHPRPRMSATVDLQDRQFGRISVTGRAHLKCFEHAPLQARMHDLSMSGFSLFLDFQLRRLQSYELKLAVYRHGKYHVVEVRAQCVYAMLVRANGFKHGFEFIGRDDRAEDAIRAILA